MAVLNIRRSQVNFHSLSYSWSWNLSSSASARKTADGSKESEEGTSCSFKSLDSPDLSLPHAPRLTTSRLISFCQHLSIFPFLTLLPYFSAFSLPFRHQRLPHICSFKYIFLDLAGTSHFTSYFSSSLDTQFLLLPVGHLSLLILFILCTLQPFFQWLVHTILTFKSQSKFQIKNMFALLPFPRQENTPEAGFLT